MSRFFAPKYDNSMTLCQWFVYIYIINMAWFKDSEDGKIRRGQALLSLRDFDGVIPKSNVSRRLKELEKMGMIIVDKLNKFNNSKRVVTICHYDEINKKSGTQMGHKVGHNTQLEHIENKHEIDEIKKQWDTSWIKSGRSMELTIKPVSTNVDTQGLGNAQKTSTQKKRSKVKDYSQAHKIWIAYNDEYKLRYNSEHYKEPYFYKLANELLDQIDQNELIYLIKLFFQDNDKFLIANTHSIRLLSSRINTLRQKINPVRVNLRDRKEF